MDAVPHQIAAFLRLFTFRRVAIDDIPAHPGITIGFWLATTLVWLLSYIYFPDPQVEYSATLLAILSPLLCALAATWLLGRNDAYLHIANAYFALEAVAVLAWFILLWSTASSASEVAGTFELSIWMLVAGLVFLWGNTGSVAGVRRPAVLASYPAVTIAVLGLLWLDAYATSWAFSSYDFASEYQESDYEELDPEKFWTSQPRLVNSALKELENKSHSGSDVFVLSLAADGSQDIFGREARKAGDILQARYGGAGKPVLLSNDALDVDTSPAAARTNVEQLFSGLAKTFEPENDILVVYATSHGSRDATLSTYLSDYSELTPLSAEHLAEQLDAAGIRKRVVIVSACYSGSWIKPLKSPGTIVISASHEDRTSFGCNDERQYTLFGEALVKSSLKNGASLASAFAEIKKYVEEAEAEAEIRESKPQVFVGDDMREFWFSKSE